MGRIAGRPPAIRPSSSGPPVTPPDPIETYSSLLYSREFIKTTPSKDEMTKKVEYFDKSIAGS